MLHNCQVFCQHNSRARELSSCLVTNSGDAFGCAGEAAAVQVLLVPVQPPGLDLWLGMVSACLEDKAGLCCPL